MKFAKLLDAIIAYSFYSLFFLVPLFLTPWNFELFEFNKMLLVYFFTIIIIASWLAKMWQQKKIKIQSTPLDIPLLLFLYSQIIATVFSLHSHTSIWGYYSRSHGGLASTIAYLFLFYSLVTNLDKKKITKAIYLLLLSAFLVASYGVLEHFGIDKDYWVQDVQNRVFSTLGQPNWLAAWLGAIIPLTWGLFLKAKTKISPTPKTSARHILPRSLRKAFESKKKFLNPQYLYLLLYLLFYLCLLYTKSRSGLMGFFISFLVFFSLLFADLLKSILQNIKKAYRDRKVKTHRAKLKTSSYKTRLRLIIRLIKKQPHISFLVIILGLTLLTNFLVGTEFSPSLGKILRKLSIKSQIPENQAQTSEKPVFAPTISKSSDIRKVVWKGALLVWLDKPKTILFGDGPETFAYAYYNHRPKAHNLFSEWDFLYNKAHNEYLNFLANSGILGLGSYLAIIGFFMAWNLKKNKKKELQTINYALLAGFTAILMSNFFGFSVVAVALLFFLFPAFSFILADLPKKSWQVSFKKIKITNYKSRMVNYLPFLFILFFTSYCLSFITRLWLADYYFAQGKGLSNSGFALRATEPLKKAIQLNNKEASFHAELAESAALLATSLPEEPEEQNLEELAIWYQLAFEETEIATRLNPIHLNILKSQVKVYVRLAQIDPTVLNKAYETLNQAIKLAPTEAKIFYNQAIILNQLEKKEEAIKLFEEAINLKPNYRQARFALALLYKESNQPEKAEEQLKFILEKINPEDKVIKQELENLLNP